MAEWPKPPPSIAHRWAGLSSIPLRVTFFGKFDVCGHDLRGTHPPRAGQHPVKDSDLRSRAAELKGGYHKAGVPKE